MIELALLACLSATPTECRTFVIPGPDGAGLLACVMASQPQAAKWQGDNPRWQIRKVACRRHMDDA